MKKLASLVCALALVFAVSAPAYAAGSNDNQIVINALHGSFTTNSKTYTLPGATIARVTSYLNAHAVPVGRGDSIASAIGRVIDLVKAQVSVSGDPDLKHLTNRGAILAEMGSVAYAGQSFTTDGNSITIMTGGEETTIAIPTLSVRNNDNDNDNSSPSTPSTPTTPSGSTSTTTTGANGGTAVSVSASPDAAPVVSGGTSSFGVTIPSTLVSSGISSATAEKPAQVNITAPTDTLVGQLNDSTVQAVAMNLTVPSEIAYGTAANVSVSMNVDSAVLAAAKQTGKDVSISVTDSLSGKVAYSWTFKGSDLAASGNELKNVNLSMNVKSTVLDSALSSAVPSDKKGVVLTFADNGTLPAPATVSVYVGDQGFAAGQTVYLYYYNQATGKIESVEYPSATVDANGYASFVITHCSQYVALPQQIAGAVAPVKIDTGSRLTVKAGKTYQFKITASSKPTFASGNGSVFQVTDNGSKGNDYFFKVTAVGKVGQSTGFYVNGAKAPATVGTIA